MNHSPRPSSPARRAALVLALCIAARAHAAQRLYVTNDVSTDGTSGGQISVFNASTGAYVSDFTSMLSYPTGTATDPFGDLFVGTYGDDAVHAYLASGAEVTYSGHAFATGGSAFDSPTSVSFSNGYLYVASATSGFGIGRVDSSGNAVAYVSNVNPNARTYTSISNVALDSAGNLYALVNAYNLNNFTISNNENFILRFAPNWSPGSPATVANIYQTLSPDDLYTGLAFDPSGELCVGQFDGSTSQILRLNASTFNPFVTLPTSQVAGGFDFDRAGNLYIATESTTPAIWRVPAGSSTPTAFITQAQSTSTLLPVSVMVASSTAVWTTDASSTWSTAANWIGPPPNEADAIAVLGPGISAPRTITLASPITLGELDLNSPFAYTLSGAVSLHFQTTGGPAALNVLAGSHTLAVQTVSFDTSTTLSLAANTSLSLPNAVTIAAGATLTKSGAGALSLGSLAGPGVLDLTTSSLTITSMAQSDVASLLRAGTITSSSALPGLQTLGLLSGAQFQSLYGPSATFNGRTVSPTDMLLKLTYAGDADFSGSITIDDYLRIDAGFAEHLPATWYDGDFNFDNVINYQDYALIDNAYRQQSGPLADDFIARHAAAFGAPYTAALQALDALPIPEPSTACLYIAGAALALLIPRRRATAQRGDNSPGQSHMESSVAVIEL